MKNDYIIENDETDEMSEQDLLIHNYINGNIGDFKRGIIDAAKEGYLVEFYDSLDEEVYNKELGGLVRTIITTLSNQIEEA